MTQHGFGFDEGTPDNARLLEADADFTPVGVILQYLYAQKDRGLRPKTILDPAAGSGAFGRCLRHVFPETTIVGVELREEEIDGLVDMGVYDLVVPASYPEFAKGAVERFDLIVTNPPFTLWREYVLASQGLLSQRGLISFLGPNGWGQRGEEDHAFFEENPPVEQQRISGSIHFRGDRINPKTNRPYGSDTRDYSWWERGKTAAEQPWTTFNLARLPGALRRWKGQRPGQESEAEFLAIADQVLSVMGLSGSIAP